MTTSDDNRFNDLYGGALAAGPQHWDSYLDRHCDDAALRARVRAALGRHEVGTQQSDVTAQLRTDQPGHAAPAVAGRSDAAIGSMIGPYRIVKLLGEGGFGTVWLAERREPMVQRVALKIIKSGMDSGAVIARFQQERQALAVMDHPNVARVFDGGVTSTGRPYFVMEYVKGEPITDFADRRRLTLRQRLELFIPVCEAVQHAHMKGIIHRDIKPSNILVEEIDGSPVVKVIDFGVAKAITQDDWAQTAFTQEGAVIGTPEYMSPEQVSGLADVDTRSDVYSLGVVLYELLTGELPFDSVQLRRVGLAEIQRVIREVTPPKPSTRLMQVAQDRTTQIVTGRSTTRERLTAELRRELDWIPLMALRKERDRRYASAGALAEDVRRYLDGLPLIAAPDSRVYLARKFVRRNRVQVLAGTAVFLALGVGLAAAIWQANEAEQQRDEAVLAGEREAKERARADERADAAERAERAAEAARDAERERAEQLRKVSDFQSRMLAQIDTTKAGIDLMADVRERFVAALEKAGVGEEERTARVDALRQELVRVNATDAAAAMIDRTILRPAVETIDREFKDQPRVDAQLRQSLANLYQTIGLYDAAMPLQESALATRRLVLGEEHPETLTSVGATGDLFRTQGSYAEAEPLLREAMEKSRRVLGEEHPDTLAAINSVGILLHAQGRLAEAESFLRVTLEKSRRVLGDEHPNTLSSIGNIATLLVTQGRLDEAELYFHQVLEMRRRVLGEEHPDTLFSIGNMGVLLDSQGKRAEAEMYHRETLEKRQRALGEEHPETLNAINNLGINLANQGKFAEAELYYRETLKMYRRVLGRDHPNTLTCINNMGYLLHSQGKLEQAEPYYREALENRRIVLGEEHPETLISLASMGVLLMALGKLAEAEPFLRESLEKFRRVLGEEHPYTGLSTMNMGGLLKDQGKLAEAEPYYREAQEKFRRVLGEEHPNTLRSINGMGILLRDQGKFAEAESYLREALEKRRRVLGEEHPDTLISISNMGVLLQSQGKPAEAEPYFREALEKRRRVLGEEHPDTLTSIQNMAVLLGQQHMHQEAIELLTPAEPAARKSFTGGKAPRLATFLTVLGRARVGLGYDAERFALAEVNLLDAHAIYVDAKDRGPAHKETKECVAGLVGLYEAWHAAEPEKGYDAKAAEWRNMLPADKQDDSSTDEANGSVGDQ